MAPPSRPVRSITAASAASGGASQRTPDPGAAPAAEDQSRSSAGGAEGDVELIDGALRPRPAPRSSRTPIAVAGRRPLRVLLLFPRGDSQGDILLHELRACGYEPIPERADTLEELRAALQRVAAARDGRSAAVLAREARGAAVVDREARSAAVIDREARSAAVIDREARSAAVIDLILSESHLPHLAALDALRELRAHSLDLPFIVVSSSLGEEAAGPLLRAGAHDFLSRGCLTRLGPAIDRELRQARLRRERREVVHELRLTKERYRLLLESVRDHAVVLLDREGRVASWSRAAERATGYQREQAIGLDLSAFYEPADQQAGRPQAALQRAAEAGGIHEEGWRLRKDGSRFYAECAIHAISGGVEAPRERASAAVVDRERASAAAADGFLLVLRDLSERRQLLQDLRAAWSREATLLAAREALRAQAGTVRLGVEALRGAIARASGGTVVNAGEPGEGRALRAGLAALQREVARLDELSREPSDGALPGPEGRLQLRRERFDLARLLREVATRSQAQVARSGSRLWLRTEEPVFGRWDRLRLDAVVTNLLGNALKYGEGKPVELRLSAESDAARLAVKDRGIGMLPEEQTRLLHGVETGVPSGPSVGNGVGLWIVRQVVLAHGGSIEVESQRGEGTTITIVLPYDAQPDDPEAPRAQRGGTAPPPDSHGPGSPLPGDEAAHLPSE